MAEGMVGAGLVGSASLPAHKPAEAGHMAERISDAELVERARRGEKAAFDELLDRHYNVVSAAAYKVLLDVEAAKDCAQDAFLEAISNLDDLRDASKFAHWIYGIAYRKAIYVLRRQKLHSTAMVHKSDESKAVIRLGSPSEQAEKGEKLASIRKALGDIPEIYREVIVLKIVDGRSHAEIAQILDLSHAAVDKRLTRGKDLLRESLKRWKSD
ncbi:MAG TPA: RNA polymerase sigma factor [Planctomycetota bacterium]|nr:RNA polymerase sigma factor [Planctomycetota bacterium]